MRLLRASDGRTREAAARTLYHMSAASAEFCNEAFSGMCKAVLEQKGEAAVLAALEPLYSGQGGEEAAAAAYLVNVLSPAKSALHCHNSCMLRVV